MSEVIESINTDEEHALFESVRIKSPARIAAHRDAVYSLDTLLAGITPENIHDRADFGKPAGRELL